MYRYFKFHPFSVLSFKVWCVYIPCILCNINIYIFFSSEQKLFTIFNNLKFINWMPYSVSNLLTFIINLLILLLESLNPDRYRSILIKAHKVRCRGIVSLEWWSTITSWYTISVELKVWLHRICYTLHTYICTSIRFQQKPKHIFRFYWFLFKVKRDQQSNNETYNQQISNALDFFPLKTDITFNDNQGTIVCSDFPFDFMISWFHDLSRAYVGVCMHLY